MSITNSRFMYAFLGVLLVAVLLPYTIDSSFMRKSNQIRTILEDGDKITDLATGNSHSMAISFPPMGLNGLSIHDIGLNSEEIYTTYIRAVKYLPNLERVWLSIGPGTFWNNLTDPELDNILMPKYGVICLYWEDWNIRFEEFWRRPKELLLDYMGFHGREKVFVRHERGLPVDMQELDLSQLDRLAQETNEVHQSMAGDHANNILYTEKMIEHAAQRNIDVIFLIPPFTKAFYNSSLQMEYSGRTDEILRTFADKYPNVINIDAHDLFQPVAQGNAKYFLDDDHLNYPGAIALGKYLKDNEFEAILDRKPSN